MANVGRYPLKSAWSFGRCRKSSRLEILRNRTDSPYNNPTIWQDWFLGSDGIGFGIIKRWNGTAWVENTKMRVHAF